MLRDSFGASSVLLFGSLAEGRWFGEQSDIDVAVTGLASEAYFAAVARLQDLSVEFEFDLVDLDRCSARLHDRIIREGKPL
jgi:predicted nucleotidyltransferase